MLPYTVQYMVYLQQWVSLTLNHNTQVFKILVGHKGESAVFWHLDEKCEIRLLVHSPLGVNLHLTMSYSETKL